MIVGNRRAGRFVVVSAIALLVLCLIAVVWCRKSRKVTQQPPMHACLKSDLTAGIIL
jgi:hypothetical protein